jgi:hypothetical protein
MKEGLMTITKCSAADCRRTERLTAFRYPYPVPGGVSQDMLLCPTHLRLMKRLASESEKTRRLAAQAGLTDQSGNLNSVKLARELKHEALASEGIPTIDHVKHCCGHAVYWADPIFAMLACDQPCPWCLGAPPGMVLPDPRFGSCRRDADHWAPGETETVIIRHTTDDSCCA